MTLSTAWNKYAICPRNKQIKQIVNRKTLKTAMHFEKAIPSEGLLFAHLWAIKAGETVAFGISEWIMVFSQTTAVDRFAFNYCLPFLSSCPPSQMLFQIITCKEETECGLPSSLPRSYTETSYTHTYAHIHTEMDCSACCPPASLNNHRSAVHAGGYINSGWLFVYIYFCRYSVCQQKMRPPLLLSWTNETLRSTLSLAQAGEDYHIRNVRSIFPGWAMLKNVNNIQQFAHKRQANHY